MNKLARVLQQRIKETMEDGIGDIEPDFGVIGKDGKELALYPGEPEAYCYIDSTEGEYLPRCGGGWNRASFAGVFYVHLGNPRTGAYGSLGFRSAYFRKLKTE